MGNGNNQKNSFVSMMERVALLNKNATEIITKLTDVVTSNDSTVTIKQQQIDGSVTETQLPTVGYLKNELDIANSNIKKLYGLNGDDNTVILDDGTTKKIKSLTITREPKQVANIPLVSQFNQKNNWFFDGLMNPLLSVNLTLTDQIEDSVNKILSRRYIVKFQRNADGTLTTNGQTSLNDFTNQFLNNNNFTINEFLTWLTNQNNTGVQNNTTPDLYMDEQIFDINFKEIHYKGYFSVLQFETDRINNKLWYHFNTLNYYGRDGSTRTLSIGDRLAINKKNSYTIYKVREINTSSSLFRVDLERVEGYDPVSIGNAVLEFYSDTVNDKSFNVSIGFDEYNVIFVKPVNTENNVICSTWSKGMAFYTNDLVLDTSNNVSIVDYYVNNVFDYGAVLKDLVSKKIPSQFGSTPNTPIINEDNFKVVQINKHLTDSKDLDSLKKLHSQKNSTKSKLEQINEAIANKNKELNTKSYKSSAERTASQNELNKLIQKQETETKSYSSIVSQITNSKIETDATPKFRVRGFWDIPDPIIKEGFRAQEVIGFEIQYRYSSKYGTQNSTEGYESRRNVVDSNGNSVEQKSTSYFSNWISLKTDIRKRTYDETTGQWYWEIEDTSDADTPNINQLDIAIQKNEKVEIRIRSISEVGYPDSPIYSDWSELLTVDFPDDLNDVLGENKFILEEASKEEMRVQFENELTAKGINKHVSESFYANEQYFSHNDKTIATSFKNTNNETLSLYEYLDMLNTKIKSLEEIVKRAKGELKVTIFKNTEEYTVTNDSNVKFTVECSDYSIVNEGSTYSSIKYINNVYLIDDFYILFENIATENPLGLFSNRNYADIENNSTNAETRSTWVDSSGKLQLQNNNQYIWLENYDGTLSDEPPTPDPNYLYSGTDETDAPNIMNYNYKNLGGSYDDNSILTTDYWNESGSGTPTNYKFVSTVHPYIDDILDLQEINKNYLKIIEAQNSVKVPLNIYYKLDAYTENGNEVTVNTTVEPPELIKKLKFYCEPENSVRPFKFSIEFKIRRHSKTIGRRELQDLSQTISQDA